MESRLKAVYFLLFSFLFCISSTAQVINTIAGNGIAGYTGDGGPATAAEFYNIYGVAVDNSGNVYISDAVGAIRKVNTAGIISTIAGNGVPSYSGDGGPATAAEIEPCGIAIDKKGNIFIADNGSHRVRMVNTSGIISTFAGNGLQGYTGDGGPATLAELNMPWGIRVDKTGNVYIADIASEVVRMVDTSGIIHTFAGNGYHVGNYGGYFGDGGPATAAELDWPEDVDFDNAGNVYIADEHNYCIRKVNSSGIISTFAGVDYPGFYGDGGLATAAEFHSPTGITINDSGVYIVDGTSSYRVRKVNSSGIISTFAGTVHGFSGDGGPATNAELNPLMLATDTSGNIYISDFGNNRIREVYMHLNVSDNIIANISCNGGNNGNATIAPREGLTPYTYLWSNGATTSSVTDLSAGTYTVNVVDSENIKGVVVITITQPTALNILGDSINATGNNCNGSAWVVVTGGTSAYNYLWTGSLTTDTITNQCAGTYCCMITDGHGCKDSTCVIINMTTGVQSIVSEPPINIYPNPGNGNFTIHYSSSFADTKSEFEVYNIYGERIFYSSLSPTITEHEIKINLSTQPIGVYLYRVKNELGESVGSGKLIIEN